MNTASDIVVNIQITASSDKWLLSLHLKLFYIYITRQNVQFVDFFLGLCPVFLIAWMLHVLDFKMFATCSAFLHVSGSGEELWIMYGSRFVWQWCGLAVWLGSPPRDPHIVTTPTTSSQGKKALCWKAQCILVVNKKWLQMQRLKVQPLNINCMLYVLTDLV